MHRLYATFIGVRDATDAALSNQSNAPGAKYNHMNTIYVRRSDDGGLTWTDTTAYSTSAESTKELDLIFPVISVVKAGNVFSAWTDGNKIPYAVSTDGATTFSSASPVNPGEAGPQATGGTAHTSPSPPAGSAGPPRRVRHHRQARQGHPYEEGR